MQKVALFTLVISLCFAMDLVVHAAAFGLGVKSSAIRMPWEKEPLCKMFQKKPRLIPPPIFAPMVKEADDVVAIPKDVAEGKIRWSKRTSVIPWPVAQDRAMAKALECWRILIMDNLQGSMVGRQIYDALQGAPGAPPIEQTIADALAGKAVSTLRARSSALLDFGRWKKGLNSDAFIFPVHEEEAYTYIRELKEHNAARTKPSRFVEALTFALHMIGAEVGQAASSPRVRGAAVMPFVVPKKKIPLTAKQVALFERIAMSDEGQNGIFAGYVCMILHMRLRWTDGQFCVHEPFTDIHDKRGFLECQLYHHKTAGRHKLAKRLLPAACVIPGITGEDWATPWLSNRMVHGLAAAQGVPTMPAPLVGGGWALVPLEASQATSWIRETLRDFEPAPSMLDIGTHSLKATILSMMAKAGCSGDLRRLAGYHVDPQSRMALEYSRDAQAPVLHAVEGILLAIYHGLFDPDASRSRRWPRKGCNSLELVMAELAKLASEDGWYEVHNGELRTSGETPELSDAWQKVDFMSEGYSPSESEAAASDGRVSISSMSELDERPSFDGYEDPDHAEDEAIDVVAQIVGQDLAQDLEHRIQDVVFRHVVSGCCHIAKDAHMDPSDGEAVVLRCGKVATKNFEQVDRAGNFFPYKCSRCFTAE